MEKNLLELAYNSGMSVGILIPAPLLKAAGGLGFPADLIDKAEMLPLRFDFNDPQVRSGMGVEFFDETVELNVSFDALYRVQIPYCIIANVTFLFPVQAYTPPAEDEMTESPGPGLRLV
jgi:hypothetical protein